MLGRITIRHADEVAFLYSGIAAHARIYVYITSYTYIPYTFLIKILKGTVLSVRVHFIYIQRLYLYAGRD